MIKNNKKTSKALKKNIEKFLFLLLLILILPQFVFGADVFFDSKIEQVGINQEFEVEFFLSSKEESVNAFEGKIVFSNNLLKLQEIRDGNSIVNFWIERPKLSDNAIVFSGITPGGFQGEGGLLFSIIFQTKQTGIASLELGDLRILKNDGLGSQTTINILPFEIGILEQIEDIASISKIEDNIIPDLFMPEISRDASMYGGKLFIAFATQDKGSGIAYYEIKESRSYFFKIFKKWHRAENIYLLKDQELKSHIFVKAVDRSGNERIVTTRPQNKLEWYENFENWFIIIIVLFVFCIFIKTLWRKKSKKQK